MCTYIYLYYLLTNQDDNCRPIQYVFQETLHNHNGSNRLNSDSFEALERTIEDEQKTEMEKTSKKNLLKNWPLMSSVIVYCIFSLHDMAYLEVFPFSYLFLKGVFFLWLLHKFILYIYITLERKKFLYVWNIS